MTQAQQPEALRIAMHLRSRAQISSTPGNLDTLSASAANELERQHARILELEQGKCLHQIAEPAQTARPAFEAISQFMKCEWSLDWDKAGFYSDVKVDAAFTWFEKGYMRAQHAAAPQAVQPAAVVTNEDLQDLVSKALRRAWQLGQTYWQQADSEYISQQKKSDDTQDKFKTLIEETRAALAATQLAPFAEVLTDEDMEDFVNTHGFTGDFQSMARIVEAKVLEKIAATQPAAQGLVERDEALEVVRKAFCKLQRYSFFLDSRGNVRRCADHCGNWVEFEAVHTLFEPQAVDAALAAQAKQGGAA